MFQKSVFFSLFSVSLRNSTLLHVCSFLLEVTLIPVQHSIHTLAKQINEIFSLFCVFKREFTYCILLEKGI